MGIFRHIFCAYATIFTRQISFFFFRHNPMLGKRIKREGEEKEERTVASKTIQSVAIINRFPKPPPNECVFVDTEKLIALAGTESIIPLVFAGCYRAIPVAKTFYAVITHQQAFPTPRHNQQQHDREAEIHKDPILRCDTYLEFPDLQGNTKIISYFKNLQLPALLALLRLTGVQPYRQHVILTLLLGAFHTRVGQSSPLYRQFSKTYLGEPRILRLIMDFC